MQHGQKAWAVQSGAEAWAVQRQLNSADGLGVREPGPQRPVRQEDSHTSMSPPLPIVTTDVFAMVHASVRGHVHQSMTVPARTATRSAETEGRPRQDQPDGLAVSVPICRPRVPGSASSVDARVSARS
jgi:hypothetical protein